MHIVPNFSNSLESSSTGFLVVLCRSAEISKRHTRPEDIMASRDLTMFLATNNVIINAVKDNFFPKKNKLHEVKNLPE